MVVVFIIYICLFLVVNLFDDFSYVGNGLLGINLNLVLM